MYGRRRRYHAPPEPFDTKPCPYAAVEGPVPEGEKEVVGSFNLVSHGPNKGIATIIVSRRLGSFYMRRFGTIGWQEEVPCIPWEDLR
jgi:hypothetical protein